MNRLTYAALIGFAAAEDFIGVDKCAIADETRMEDREFMRQVAQGTWKSVVKGAYHSQVDLISNDCMGEWMIPTMDKIFNTTMKAQEDPMSITIDEAYDVATSTVDLFFKNRDTCQFQKVYDDYKNWCLNNLDVCVGSDDGFLERVYNHGPDLFAAFYDLAGVMFFQYDDCNTDAEFVQEHSKIVSDISSVGTVLLGFEADYRVKNQHISTVSFQEQIQQYFDDMYQVYMDESEIDYELVPNHFYDEEPMDMGFNWFDGPNFDMDYDMPTWDQPEWEMPSYDMPEWDMPTWDMPTYDMPSMDMDFKNFKLW